jgi:hypothetical protein
MCNNSLQNWALKRHSKQFLVHHILKLRGIVGEGDHSNRFQGLCIHSSHHSNIKSLSQAQSRTKKYRQNILIQLKVQHRMSPRSATINSKGSQTLVDHHYKNMCEVQIQPLQILDFPNLDIQYK